MKAAELATIVADYLRDRDDIADATDHGPAGSPGVGAARVDVTTQGGGDFSIMVTPEIFAVPGEPSPPPTDAETPSA